MILHVYTIHSDICTGRDFLSDEHFSDLVSGKVNRWPHCACIEYHAVAVGYISLAFGENPKWHAKWESKDLQFTPEQRRGH